MLQRSEPMPSGGQSFKRKVYAVADRSRLSDIALVTGGAKRVGAAMVRTLAADGWRVAIHVRGSVDAGEALAAEITGAGGFAYVFTEDLTGPDAADRLMDAVEAELGAVGLLVNNASAFEPDALASSEPEALRRNLSLHVEVPVRLAQRVHARAVKADAQAVVINMLDQRVQNLAPGYGTYAISKQALWAATRQMALELAPHTRVNGIAPGPVLPSPVATPEGFAALCHAMPLEEGSSPEEIVAALRYLVSARSVTGQMIISDGGQHMGWMNEGEARRRFGSG